MAPDSAFLTVFYMLQIIKWCFCISYIVASHMQAQVYLHFCTQTTSDGECISSSVHVSVTHPQVTSWVEFKLLNKKKEEVGDVMTWDIHDWRGMMDMNVASPALWCLELVVLFPSRDLSPGLYDGLLHTCSFVPLIKMSQFFNSAFSMMKSCYSVQGVDGAGPLGAEQEDC